MLYRATQAVEERLDVLERHLRNAILAGDTRVISQETAAAQAITVEILTRLKTAVDAAGEDDSERTFVRAGVDCLNHAWNNAEKVGLGTSAADMRARLLDFKTSVDYATAYLRMALGHVGE
jgi:hypothetical protein